MRVLIRSVMTPRAVTSVVLSLMLAGCATTEKDRSSARQAVIDRIVTVSVKVMIERRGRRIGSGSGVVVASNGEEPGIGPVSYVLTAAHTLEAMDESEVLVRFSGAYASRGKFAATVRRRDSPDMLDLALLRVPGIAVPPVSFPAEDDVRLGEGILIVGFPWGKRLGLFSGIVSQVPANGKEDAAADEGTEQTIVVDAAASKGVSGGGVFQEVSGNLLGVVEGYQTASIALKDRAQTYSVKVPMPGETFVVPIARIRRFLQDAGLTEVSGPLGRVEDQNN